MSFSLKLGYSFGLVLGWVLEVPSVSSDLETEALGFTGVEFDHGRPVAEIQSKILCSFSCRIL